MDLRNALHTVDQKILLKKKNNENIFLKKFLIITNNPINLSNFQMKYNIHVSIKGF